MAWEHPHGNGANNSFADVNTAPAGAGSLSVPGLGSFAPGAGPVIAPDGTVYLGTTEGRLIALRADGGELWAAQLPSPQGIVSSPVIGSDGAIYVVGLSLPVRDHREGSVVTVYQAWLHKFAPTGERVWESPFPAQRNRALPYYGPRLTGAPNVAMSNGEEYVMVPAVHRAFGRDYYIVAFSARRGASVAFLVSYIPDEITGTGFPWEPPDWWPFDFIHGPEGIAFPGLPPVAAVSSGGTLPFIVVSDRVHDVVLLTFEPVQGFVERFRLRDTNRAMLSAPSVLRGDHSALGTDTGEVVFAWPSPIPVPPVSVLGGISGRIFASVTRAADAELAVVVSVYNGLALLRNHRFQRRVYLDGLTVVPAAASRTNVFVSTDNALFTFNSDVTSELRRFNWVGGGTSPPVIGPSGRVYAIASNILFIFPPPRQRPRPDGPFGGDQPPPINPG